MAKEKLLAGDKVNLDAIVAADAKLMKGAGDWHPVVEWTVKWLNVVLVAVGREPIDDEAILSPGEAFDSLVLEVKKFKATSVRAMAIKSGLIWALDSIHVWVHPHHAEGA